MNCKNCKSDCAEKGIDHEKQSCLGYLGNTNADRIRSMTDEELAGELLELFEAFCEVEWSYETLINWLGQEEK